MRGKWRNRKKGQGHKTMSFSCSPEQYQQLKDYAAILKVSVSKAIVDEIDWVYLAAAVEQYRNEEV